MSDAVFASVGQALHVSFLMEILPTAQKGSTQVFIEDLMRRYWRFEDVPPHHRSLNLSGLSPIELRGQCAMVRAAVKDHLTEPEAFAVIARYGHQRTKAEAVAGLSEYLRPLCNLAHDDARLALTWALYAPINTRRDRTHGRKDDWTLRKLSDDYGIPRSTLADARRCLGLHAKRLEQVGEDRLAALFERTGLVGDVDAPEVAA